jgi:O-acetyl-ADP-ribose deacetylase
MRTANRPKNSQLNRSFEDGSPGSPPDSAEPLRKGSPLHSRVISSIRKSRGFALADLIAIQGNIIASRVDAIVNAANSSLLGGGGVDGAIHKAAGAELLEACRKLKGCATGDAKATPGFRLPAKWIIHAVGPVWQGGDRGEDELLASCYRRCLELAREHQVSSIAFPAISTGAYRFPPESAAAIAVATVKMHIEASGVSSVHFVCFDRGTLAIYERLLRG